MSRSPANAVFMAVLFGLSACVSPSPELAKSTSAVPASERVITGAPVQDCLRDVRLRDSMEVSKTAFYEPSTTYEMANLLRTRAELFRNSRGSELAGRLQAYSVPLKSQNLIGQDIEPGYLCIFEASGGRLRFFDKISVPHGRKVQRTTYDAVVFGLMDGVAGLPF